MTELTRRRFFVLGASGVAAATVLPSIGTIPEALAAPTVAADPIKSTVAKIVGQRLFRDNPAVAIQQVFFDNTPIQEFAGYEQMAYMQGLVEVKIAEPDFGEQVPSREYTVRGRDMSEAEYCLHLETPDRPYPVETIEFRTTAWEHCRPGDVFLCQDRFGNTAEYRFVSITEEQEGDATENVPSPSS